MTRLALARTTATIAQVAGVALSFGLDWSQNHLLSPLWHPHAKFHGALLLFTLAGVAGTSVWSMWRPSCEPDVAIRMGALLSLAFWTPLFYIPSVLPGSTAWAGAASADPRLTGSVVTPNLVVALGFVAVNLVVLWLTRNGDGGARERARQTSPDHAASYVRGD